MGKSDSTNNLTPVDTERIYATVPPAEIPWVYEDPPEELVRLLDGGLVEPCRAVDLGCGCGANAAYLAERGFDVTGVDFSPSAVAQATAAHANPNCRFEVMDLAGAAAPEMTGFGFALDWLTLHHILPPDRPQFIANVAAMLDPGGVYFSVSFNEGHRAFHGDGKLRTTKLGTNLYFASEQEVADLLRPHFEIVEQTVAEVRGKTFPHLVNMVLARRTQAR